MNPIFHQLKWDFRRIRTLWIIWILLLAGTTFATVQMLGTGTQNFSLAPLYKTGKFVTTFLFGILLVTRVMSTTPFTGTRPDWKTRPLSHRALFWSKSLSLLIFIYAPVLLIQLTGWTLQNVDGRFVFWAGLQFSLLTLSIFFLAAICCAISERAATAVLCMVAFAASLGFVAIIYLQISQRVEFLPLGQSSTPHAPSTSASTLLLMVAVTLAAIAISWFIGIRRTNIRATVGALLAGVAIAAGANSLWRVDYLSPLSRSAIKPTELKATVLDRDESPSGSDNVVWSQISLNLPARQFAQPESWSTSFTMEDGSKRRSNKSNPNFSSWLPLHWQRLRDFYPAKTRINGHRITSHHSAISFPDAEQFTGTFAGEATVSIFEWKKIASVPLDQKGPVHIEGGSLKVVNVSENQIHIRSIGTPAPFSSLPTTSPSNSREHGERIAPVLYHEPSGTATVAHAQTPGLQMGARFTPKEYGLLVDLENGEIPFRRATGLKSAQASRSELRLDLYQAVKIGTSKVNWARENWTAYRNRAHPNVANPPQHTAVAVPKVAIAKIDLPPNPTSEQIAAYLDGVLFSLPDRMGRNHWKKVENELKALGPDHLDHLLNRLPVGSYIENSVQRVLKTELTEKNKPAFLQALKRDLSLTSIALDLEWENDALPILIERLKIHRKLDSGSASTVLGLVADAADPETFDDLRWHFLHCSSGISQLARTLKNCSGFPYDETIQEAWHSMRYQPGSMRTQLAPFAARLGDKEALRLALAHYLEQENGATLNLLREASAYSGPDLPGWLRHNFDALTFDQDTKQFGLN